MGFAYLFTNLNTVYANYCYKMEGRKRRKYNDIQKAVR